MKGKFSQNLPMSIRIRLRFYLVIISKLLKRLSGRKNGLRKKSMCWRKISECLRKKLWGFGFGFLRLSYFCVFYQKNGLQKRINEIDARIGEFKEQHKAIFRDYKVTKLGVAYVPVADQIKYEDKSFIVDYTGKVEESEVTLQMSRRNDLLVETIEQLESLSSEAPIVENPMIRKQLKRTIILLLFKN